MTLMNDVSGKSFQEATTDERRARELYKYFCPPANNGESPDPILTAHAQLVAWRLNAERSMITLIDDTIQYFVAESTKTLHLDNAHEHDHPDDAIWAGCVRVSKAGRLCEHTVAATPPESGGPACFEVLDLSKDTRFNALEFVAGPPHFKNYAGVPLRTRKGINIGSIFVIGSKVRPALTTTEWHFLAGVADNVMQHLEMVKDRKDCARALKMSACMSAYVDPLHGAVRPEPQLGIDDSYFSLPLAKDGSGFSYKDGNIERLTTFRRAASFLLKGLDYDESGGGVMFLDTLPSSFYPDHAQGRKSPGSTTAEILAHATQPARIASKNEPPVARINIPSPKDLSRLVKHQPNGKLYTFDSQDHALASSSEEFSTSPSRPKTPKTWTRSARKNEINKLRHCFPMTRQIVFLPIWDSSTSRWVVCLAYHGSRFRNFSHKSEFVQCATFGNTIVAELTKMASQQASQQKSDFMASISHELRSPLHGILASCEFLEDTQITPFQQALIGTADSCARTLLDTINQVLDYSNINNFEKTKDHARKDRRERSMNSQSKALQSRLSMHRTVDVAALIEEVIDGLVAGHVFGGRVKRTSFSTIHPSATESPGGAMGSVEVILDIVNNDWTFCTEPGALRRILMNLVENAIKFTQDGFVHVKVESGTQDLTGTPFINLTIADSGQGIAPGYLKDKVFSPFFQESSLTTGTGLGLSLVKSIIHTMGGKINVDSTMGIGTKVTVKLPMVRGSWTAQEKKENTDPILFDNAAERKRSVAINAVRIKALGKMAALHWYEPIGASPNQIKATRLLQASLAMYLSRWFGLSWSPWQQGLTYDIVITTCDGLNTLKESAPHLFTDGCQDTVVAIATAASQLPLKASHLSGRNFIVLSSPFGPSKMAHVLELCLDKSRSGTGHNSKDQNDETESNILIDGEQALRDAPTDYINNGLTNKDKERREQVVPENQNEEESLGSQSTRDSATAEEPGVSPPRLLLVDDNAINLRLLQVYTKKLGFTHVHCAENGQVAVHTYERLLDATPSAPPNVILMDLSMPVLDGFEATRRIRQSEARHNERTEHVGPALRSFIIALTGLASLKAQRDAFEAGVDRYLMKPVNFAKLSTLIEKWQSNSVDGADG
ncbi:hypothetical protein DM02DRAFT_600223 [Periconia macrospinosa]|uniref:Uncharacterized protein n=1 Tax=Periconia macrospinosa TaxID=97972 RepID=A0A2V1DCF0_9PLEO|nr:hypothetical protein DM02DRAFT_600223 [Periconia macrospinosa]